MAGLHYITIQRLILITSQESNNHIIWMNNITLFECNHITWMYSHYFNVIRLFQWNHIIVVYKQYCNYRQDQHNFKITKWGLESHCFNIQSQNFKFSKQFKNKQIKYKLPVLKNRWVLCPNDKLKILNFENLN